MGNTCNTEQREQFEDRVEEAAEKAREVVEDVEEKVAAVAEQAKEAVQDAVETVAEAAGVDLEKVEEKVEEAKEAVQDGVEKAADAAGIDAEEVKEKVEGVQERAAEVVESAKEGAADVAEAAAATMTAAVAAVTGVMIVEFADSKSNAKSVEFKSKDLEFTPAKGGAGCCTSAPKACVVVSKVEKNRQADKLGVKKGWGIKAVNGTEVTSLEQARKLLEEGRARIAEA